VTCSVIADDAWRTQRRELKRTVARDVKRETTGRTLLHSDGRGAREQFLQAARWMFTWLTDEERQSPIPR
jgi:hypothetical protein